MKFGWIMAAGMLLAMAGCDWGGSTDFAERSETVRLTGTIEEVDQANRLFRVRDGRTAITFRAGPQVQNFAQLEAGDRIELDYYESVAVGMADPSDTGEVIGDALVGTAAPGEKPGGGVFGSVSGVVELVSYDAASTTAVIKLNDGTTQSVNVAPEMRAFAAARQPGDRIVVAMERAVAVFVTEIE